MTEADYQLTIQCVTAVAGAIAAFYGVRNHQQAKSNGQAIAQVQETTNGTQHALASNLAINQNADSSVIRDLARSTIPPITPTPP
jgi:hypothetical protein